MPAILLAAPPSSGARSRRFRSRIVREPASTASRSACLRLVVSDDGQGFTLEERARRSGEGHLGLSLLEEMVEQEGGSFEVRSQRGAGTTVAVEVASP